MRKLKIDGKVYDNVFKIRAINAETGELTDFIDTSGTTAQADDIAAGKTAYSNGARLVGTRTGAVETELDGIVNGSIVNFIMPNGQSEIWQYRFFQMTALESADLGGAQKIGQYAFDGCTNLHSLIIPAVVTSVEQYAFRNAGNAGSETFTFETEETCNIATYAFNASNIGLLSGYFAAIGSYAFASCTKLASVDIKDCKGIGTYAFNNDTALKSVKLKVSGAVDNYAFYGCTNVEHVEIDNTSVIATLGSYAFSRFATNRPNPSENIIDLDFSKSRFPTVQSYAFGSDSSSASYRTQYMRIRLPSTLSTISGNAFRYSDHCEFYFPGLTPPTLSATTAWANATNYKIFVHYNALDAYRKATNWTDIADSLIGYIPAGTYGVGEALPELNTEGYALTWYKDKDCTEPATTIEDEGAEYYCKAGEEKLGYGFTSCAVDNCTITVSSEDKIYRVGEGIPTNTVVTITATAAEGYIPYIFTVNGEEFESGNTFEMTTALAIVAIYWDGVTVPLDPVFENNSWTLIFDGIRSGVGLQFWKPGDTKTFISNSGQEYALRLSDKQEGRYSLADGSGTTKAVLEFTTGVKISGNNTRAINATQKEGYWTGGGFAMSDMLNIYLQDFFDDLPAEIQAGIAEITMSEYSYTAPTPRSYTAKLFLPAETEVFKDRHSSAEGTGVYPKYKQFDYYAAITTSDGSTCPERQKHFVDGTSSQWWWLRSPYSGSADVFCSVYSGGGCSNGGAYYAGCVSPCFAVG